MTNKSFEWAVVGAGPSGIAAVGKLMDHGIAAENIVWIDPYFEVGDLGRHWKNVSSNTPVKLFINFLNATNSFSYPISTKKFELSDLPEEETCALQYIAEPLRTISQNFSEKVHAVKDMVNHLTLTQKCWAVQCDSGRYQAKKVILATGAEPRELHYPNVESIPFTQAIDRKILSNLVDKNKQYAVFGSSHSAIMITQSLIELGVQKVINFYRSPCRYGVNMGDWTLFDNSGLKGNTAVWARENIDGVMPDNLVRYYASEANIDRYLQDCHKAIYAVGFVRRNGIVIGDFEHIDYDPRHGIIAPGLFGFGIAYPELREDPFGHSEYQVGLWKFMTYLRTVMPVWLKYPE